MSKWLFRRSNSESVKARTEQVTARPKRPRPCSTDEKEFEDAELAELEKKLPQVSLIHVASISYICAIYGLYITIGRCKQHICRAKGVE